MLKWCLIQAFCMLVAVLRGTWQNEQDTSMESLLCGTYIAAYMLAAAVVYRWPAHSEVSDGVDCSHPLLLLLAFLHSRSSTSCYKTLGFYAVPHPQAPSLLTIITISIIIIAASQVAARVCLSTLCHPQAPSPITSRRRHHHRNHHHPRSRRHHLRPFSSLCTRMQVCCVCMTLLRWVTSLLYASQNYPVADTFKVIIGLRIEQFLEVLLIPKVEQVCGCMSGWFLGLVSL